MKQPREPNGARRINIFVSDTAYRYLWEQAKREGIMPGALASKFLSQRLVRDMKDELVREYLPEKERA